MPCDKTDRLDDPNFWRECARIAITCRFWTVESYAVHKGTDPAQARAKLATFYHPPDDDAW